MNEKRSFQFWQLGAKFYTGMQEKKFQTIYDEVVEVSKKYIRNKDVLEIACGTGQFTLPLAPMSHSWIASDYSPKMVEVADARCHGVAQFCIENAACLNFEDASFDVVFLANALHLMSEPEKVMREVFRVLRPDGLFIVPTFVFEEGVNLFRLKCMEMVGLEIVSQWSAYDLMEFVNQNGFRVIDSGVIEDHKMVEAFVVGKKIC